MWTSSSMALCPVIFRVVCAWCNGVERDGTPNAPVSHTICAKCEQALYFPGTTAYPSLSSSTQTVNS